jgi:hypothetical protein
MDQRAGLALATIGNGEAAIREALTAGFDSSWRKHMPSSLQRHAARHRLFMHQIGLQPIRDGRNQLSIA